jgi:subtilisin family serine protease
LRLSLATIPVLLAALGLPGVADAGSVDGGGVEQVIVQVEDGRDAPQVAADAGAMPVTGSTVPAAPVVSLEVDESGLRDLRADPRVEAVMTRGTRVELAMAQSVAKVGAAGRHTAGFDGDGKVIAVIDTGVAATFGGSLVGQACFAATQVGPVLEGHCGTGGDQERAFDQACFTAGVCDGGESLDPQAARPCTGTATSCEHGTAVAAIAARDEIPRGVAPGAGVYAVQVFNPSGTSADLVDLYLALEHLIEMSDAGALDLAAVNLSVATSATFIGDCRAAMGPDGTAYDFIFGQLRTRGIAPVVSSGNDGKTAEIAFPACVPSAISVGATDLDDDLASFGNRGPGLDLLAPGADEASFGASVDPMEIPGNSVGSWIGTSFSAPHVTGAFALLDQEYPQASVEQRTWFLQAAGVPVSEGGRTYRRLMLRPPEQVLLAQRLFPGEAAVGGTARVALGDVDGDGRADVVAHTPGQGPDRIAYGSPGWGFTGVPLVVNASYVPIVANVTTGPTT